MVNDLVSMEAGRADKRRRNNAARMSKYESSYRYSNSTINNVDMRWNMDRMWIEGRNNASLVGGANRFLTADTEVSDGVPAMST